MNRLPKYKAWDIQYKQLVNVTMMLFIGDSVEIDHDQNNNEPKDIEHFNLMEFTQQKTISGEEIFEGYILKIKLPMGGFWGNVKREETGQVVYNEDKGCFVVNWGIYKYGKNQSYVELNCDIAHNAIVLGNIYQNPELLK